MNVGLSPENSIFEVSRRRLITELGSAGFKARPHLPSFFRAPYFARTIS